eukprot:1148647-Pelagomonas_calceolata.AAC.2
MSRKACGADDTEHAMLQRMCRGDLPKSMYGDDLCMRSPADETSHMGLVHAEHFPSVFEDMLCMMRHADDTSYTDDTSHTDDTRAHGADDTRHMVLAHAEHL